MASTLNLATILVPQPMARTALGSRVLSHMAFWAAHWMALAANTEARVTYGRYLGGWVGNRRHTTYLCSLS